MDENLGTSTTVSAPDTFRFLRIFFERREGVGDGSFSVPDHPIVDFLAAAWDVYSIIAFIISFIFITGIVYAYLESNKLQAIRMQRIRDEEKKYQEKYRGVAENSRWRGVERHLDSENPSDWKLAIIEADIMLGEALTSAGYAGTTIGEQLKSISPSALTSLDDAWQAHRIRNQIAHEGADFVLTRRTAQDTIVMYRKALKEFGVI